MRASPPVDEPTSQGEVLAAAPQEAPAAAEVLAAAPPRVAPFDPPECEATAAPADALDALVTPGNVHRYLAYLSWHWAIRGVHLVEERIVEARRIGGATVARGEVRVLACLGSDEECASLQARWEGGGFVRVLRGQRLDRAEGEDVLPSSASELEALLRESALLEVPTRASRRPICWRTGCGTYDMRSDRGGTTWAWILPHVGLAASSVGDYSPETGDGTAVTRVLVAWSLRTPVPSASSSPAPSSFAATREAAREAVARGELRFLERALAPAVQISMHAESSDPPASVLETWGQDESRSWLRLGAALEGECAEVGGNVVCPASEAMPLARVTGRCHADVGETPPRALFVRGRGGFQLAAFLVGGADDLWTQPQWTDRPARPHTQRARFVDELRTSRKSAGHVDGRQSLRTQ